MLIKSCIHYIVNCDFAVKEGIIILGVMALTEASMSPHPHAARPTSDYVRKLWNLETLVCIRCPTYGFVLDGNRNVTIEGIVIVFEPVQPSCQVPTSVPCQRRVDLAVLEAWSCGSSDYSLSQKGILSLFVAGVVLEETVCKFLLTWCSSTEVFGVIFVTKYIRDGAVGPTGGTSS